MDCALYTSGNCWGGRVYNHFVTAPMADIKPTEEQLIALTAADAGCTLKIKAYAGAGKTSTLKMLAARKVGKRGRYLAFNKQIAESAKSKFPSSVKCSTWHSLAYRQVPSWLRDKLNLPKEPPHDLVTRYGLGPLRVPSVIGKTVEISAFQLGCMIQDGTARFCRSAQGAPDGRHIHTSDLLDDKTAEELRAMLVPHVTRHWEECLTQSSRAGISPDVYLKVWEQSRPVIQADYLLCDEMQDSDGLMLSVLRRQTHLQALVVGDPYQQIYEWRGAVNAMEYVRAEQVSLTESFRFGPRFALLASKVLGLLGETTPLRGQVNINSILVENPTSRPAVDAILCRKNATAIAELAAGLEAGHRVAVRANVKDIQAFADGADRLIRGERAWSPTSLVLFETWKDVQEYANTFAGRDLLPIITIIDEQGTAYLRSLLARISPEDEADYVISTIHGAKGLEWDRVRVCGDFRFKQEDDGCLTLTDEEKRLLYVAITRARQLMDVSDLKQDLMQVFEMHARTKAGFKHAVA